MPFDILIRNATLVTSTGERRLDCAIEDGKIVEIAPALQGSAHEEIDANGLHVFPGVIDCHVHFNEPGRTDWEGFATGSSALAAGGGTSFFDMPLNSNPPTLDGESFELKKEAGLKSSLVDFGLWGGLTPKNLDKMEELAERGVIGFKAFMSPSGIDEFPHADDFTLLRGMEIASKLRLPVAVHAENGVICDGLARDAIRNGRTTMKDYLESRPVIAEIEAIQKAMLFAEQTKCALHVVHVSSVEGIDLISASAARMKVDVTCETCAHYLALTDGHAVEIGANAKCAPPLRSKDNRRQMRKRLRNGRINIVASDHSPAPAQMKASNNLFEVWGGISGVQSTLEACLSIPHRPLLRSIASMTSSRVADRFKLASKGQIEVGFDADLALVDLNQTHELKREDLLDRHKLSPYVGRKFKAKIVRTIARGRTVYQNGRIVGKADARLLVPNRA